MLKLIQAPASEPLTPDEAKSQLLITHSEQDTKIDSIIKAARTQFESDVPNMQLITSTWCLYLDTIPAYSPARKCHILLNKYPITEVASDAIKYYTSGEEDLQTLSTGDYRSDIISYPGRIYIENSPSLDSDKFHALQVTFKAGWASADNIPQDIKQALYLLIGHFFENRQQVMTGTQIHQLPLGYQQIINNYRAWL